MRNEDSRMKILICTDGLPAADQAVHLGATIAAACAAEVTLLGVVENPGEADQIMDALRRGRQWFEEKKIHAEAVTVTGQPIEEIVKRTTTTPYDLVIIGAAKKGSSGLFWRSSKTYTIIKRIDPPVLVAMEQSIAIKRVLVCSGGKKDMQKALALTSQLALGLGAGVTLFHVLPEAPALFEELRREEVDPAVLLESRSLLGRTLHTQKLALESAGVPVEVKLRQGPMPDQIIEEIQTGHYDLVVAGSAPGRGGLHTYVLGNVTREIVNRADCAVLVVRTSAGRAGFIRSVSGWLKRGKAAPAQ